MMIFIKEIRSFVLLGMAEQVDMALLRELIRLTLHYKGKAGFGSKMTETSMQKTLYELKRKLPEVNPIKEQLSYYWFKAGAFSEFVKRELESMLADGVLNKEQRENYTLLELEQRYANTRFVEHDEHVQEARDLLLKIVSNLQNFSIQNEIKSQYEDDAPSFFYPRFKLEFLPNLEGYYNLITKIENKKADRSQRDCIAKFLNIATSSLLINSLYSDFKRSYFDFETAFYRVMRWSKKDTDSEYQEMLKQSIVLSSQIWDTFAYGARIIKHDPIYEQKVDGWKTVFNEKVVDMSSKINEFYLKVLEVTDPKDFDEQVISLQRFIELVTEYRKEKEIAFINFQTAPNIPEIVEKINTKTKNIPEFTTFLTQGQLDWRIIKELSDSEITDIIRNGVGSEPVSVAFSDNGTKIVTYRIESNSLSVAGGIELPN